MKFQTSLNNPTETIAKQNSTVSKQAKLLPAKKRTVLQSTLLKKFPLLIQSHLERIADFVLLGKNVWWSVDAEDGMIFHDGPEDDERRPDGPQLHHFRSRSLKEERMWIKQKWQECLHHFASGELQLPFRRLLTGNAENCQSERDEASVANTGNGGHQQTIDCKDFFQLMSSTQD